MTGEGIISSRDLADAVGAVDALIGGLRYGAETRGVLPPAEELTLVMLAGTAKDKLAVGQLSGMLAVALLRLATVADREP